jgi:hypothetical protein
MPHDDRHVVHAEDARNDPSELRGNLNVGFGTAELVPVRERSYMDSFTPKAFAMAEAEPTGCT